MRDSMDGMTGSITSSILREDKRLFGLGQTAQQRWLTIHLPKNC